MEAVIFNGGYGYDYVKFAADQVKKQKDFSGVTIEVSPSTHISRRCSLASSAAPRPT